MLGCGSPGLSGTGKSFSGKVHWGRLLRCRVTARVTVLSDPFVITFDGKEDRPLELQPQTH